MSQAKAGSAYVELTQEIKDPAGNASEAFTTCTSQGRFFPNGNPNQLNQPKSNRMQRKPSSTPLVNEQRFILATRDTGYHSTASAIAELVDNSIQANASIIRIFVTQQGIGNDRQVSVAVLDNGNGMDQHTLSIAMQFAGSSRFNDRNGLGRFGMGLPNSSVSQARRVDVYTWQKRKRVLHTYLDVDEITDGEMKKVPQPRVATLPSWVEKHVRKQTGTLVQWLRCDRLDNRKATTIAEKLQRPLGQRFRYFLWKGNRIFINDDPVIPFDPLYLRVDETQDSAIPFGNELPFEFRCPFDPTRTSTVHVRFSELPVARWYGLPVEAKRALGVPKGAGVSVIRADREIDYGWYFMGGKRKENYDDWWRCEISFDPELDELFGVTHSKQEINPVDVLRTELSSHLEVIAQTLNSRARAAFMLARKQDERSPSRAEAKATDREAVLPPMRSPQIAVTSKRPNQTTDKSLSASSAATKTRYRIRVEAIQIADAFIWSADAKGDVTITVNQNHAFHDQVFSRLANNKDQAVLNGVECLLLAFARAALAVEDDKSTLVVTQFRRSFSNILAAYLGD